jgi:hypothetical protein
MHSDKLSLAMVCALAACSSEPAIPAEGPMPPYALAITSTVTPAPGTPTPVLLELRDARGTRVSELEVVHEKLLHMIVVSSDLGVFVHEHPTRRPDGVLEHALVLPRAGDYTVFADFTPRGGKNTVTSAPFVVPGTAPAPVALTPVTLPAGATQGAFAVELTTDAPIAPGTDTMLSFAIRDANGPVADLRPYLGALGHAVIISEDRSQFLHSHPMAGADGSTVRFHTRFPAPGTYKVWGEFRPRGEPLRVSFTLAVPVAASTAAPAPPAPAHPHGGHAH